VSKKLFPSAQSFSTHSQHRPLAIGAREDMWVRAGQYLHTHPHTSTHPYNTKHCKYAKKNQHTHNEDLKTMGEKNKIKSLELYFTDIYNDNQIHQYKFKYLQFKCLTWTQEFTVQQK